MAEGGYLEGILEFKDVTKVVVEEQEVKKECNINFPKYALDEPQVDTEDKKREEHDCLVNSLTHELEAALFDTKTKDLQEEQENKLGSKASRPTYDLERANAELEAVKEAHTKLVAEKNALILAFQSGRSLVQGVISETERLERSRDDLQEQVKETYVRIKAENDAIEEIKQSGMKDLAEAESLKAQARILNCELDRCEQLKNERGETIKDLYSEVAYKKILISNLQNDKKSLTEGEVPMTDNSLVDQVKEGTEHFSETQREIKDGVITIKDKIEDDLKFTRDKVSEMEKKNSELTKTLLTKDKEIQNMSSRLKDVQALKIKQNKQLEELQNCFEKLGEQTAIERNKNRAHSAPDIEHIANDTKETESTKLDGKTDLSKLKDDMKESNDTHEETLSLIRQHHTEVLTDFDNQIQAARRKKPKQETKSTAKKSNPKQS
eukprot:TRINITY_DN15687_c0_g1_i1.p1 TRINITY_DN15687_c0_g1~~TRINITY_DN15687_c0_g1_i1.p1  ORF type:complete len:460 (-),score=133.39 TRINITY_DN15687_c0_g1_i1:62-1372(-)